LKKPTFNILIKKISVFTLLKSYINALIELGDGMLIVYTAVKPSNS